MKPVIFVLLSSLVLIKAATVPCLDSDTSLRGGHRCLPGFDGMDFDLGDMDNVEAGFAVGVLFTILLLCCLLYMCCGGGPRCSFWDCLALFCLWEICCDGNGGNPSDFVLV